MSSILNKNKLKISSNLRTLRNIIANATIKDLEKGTTIPEKSISMYEAGYKTPSLKNLLIFSKCFSVSVDFFLLWEKTPYPRSLKMIFLSSKIDKMDEIKRFQIVTIANILIGSKNVSYTEIKFDDFNINLTDNLHENLKILRQKKGVSQIQVANDLNLNQARISAYEKNQTPKAEMLIKFSNYYDISIHALTTGEKLFYSFKNDGLLEVILKADRLLSLEDKKTIIKLMERIIQNQEQQ